LLPLFGRLATLLDPLPDFRAITLSHVGQPHLRAIQSGQGCQHRPTVIAVELLLPTEVHGWPRTFIPPQLLVVRTQGLLPSVWIAVLVPIVHKQRVVYASTDAEIDPGHEPPPLIPRIEVIAKEVVSAAGMHEQRVD
jgi:hypothetical protein